MAAPDNDQYIGSQSDSSEGFLPESDSEASEIIQTTSITNFHYYIHLPFELRAQIRTEAIKSAKKRSRNKKPLSRLTSVSKEWQDDVERVLFGEIRIDPLDEEQISTFKRLFTDRRKKFLTRLDIAIDDEEETSPWHQNMGLLQISQVMEKVGQFFHYINGWSFCREGEKQQSIDFILMSQQIIPGHHSPKYEQPHMSISSLWEKQDLDVVTNRGLIPTNIALWAIKSEFPSSLNMITHLTFLPDCVPLSAAQKIIKTMPNLETCVLEVSFGSESEDGWRSFTDFILHLRISAPSLRKLMLHSQNWVSKSFVPSSMERFAVALRDFSQGLEILRAEPLDLHHAFFLQSSEGLNPAAAASQWRWPRLQQIELRGFSERFDFGADQLKVTATDILIAAGTAATAMPALEIAEIEIEPRQYFCIKRERCKGIPGFQNASICLVGFDEGEEQRISNAWAHFIGGEARLVKQKIYDDGKPPMRVYGTVLKEDATS